VAGAYLQARANSRTCSDAGVVACAVNCSKSINARGPSVLLGRESSLSSDNQNFGPPVLQSDISKKFWRWWFFARAPRPAKTKKDTRAAMRFAKWRWTASAVTCSGTTDVGANAAAVGIFWR